MKAQANDYFEKKLAERGIEPNRMITAPTISNIFLWRMVAETDGQYHVAYWSVFDDDDRLANFTHLPKGHEHLKDIEHFPETDALKWFAKDWHMTIPDHENPENVLLIDLRFAELVTNDLKRPPFVWRLEPDPNNPQHLKFTSMSYRKDAPMKEAIDLLWQRIQGKAPNWMDVPWPWEEPKPTNT